MKKLLLFCAIIIGSYAAQAQATNFAHKQSPSLNQLGIHFWGINTPGPSCTNDRGTNLYAVNPFWTTVTPPGLIWLATPPTATFITGFNLDVDMGGGLHYGTPVFLCGLTTGTYSLMLGGVYPVTMDVVVSGSNYTFDFY